MELEHSLLIYFCVIFFLFRFFIKACYTIFTSFYIASVLSVILLLIIYPINSEGLDIIKSENMLYFTIIIVSGIIFISYSMIMALNDIKTN